MNAWLDWPDSPGPWWMRNGDGTMVCQAFDDDGEIYVQIPGIDPVFSRREGCKFQTVQPPDSDPSDWHDRPTCAGRWLIVTSNVEKYSYLTETDVANWFAYKTRCFGPIPEDKP